MKRLRELGESEWPWYAGLLLSVFTGLLYTYGYSALSTRSPIQYEGDSLHYMALFRAVFDSGWYTDLARLGAPFGSTHHDFPIPDGLFLIYVRLLGLVAPEPALAYKSLFFGGFFAVAISFFFAARKLHIPRSLSFVGAMSYAFLPFHFMRLDHLFYTLYFVHPLIVLVTLRLNDSRLAPLSRWLSWRKLALFVITGAAGVYGAFFAILVLCFGSAAAGVQHRNWQRLAYGLVGSAIIGLTVIANLVPVLAYQATYGSIPVAKRAFGESEIYGLKLTQLLLPTSSHPLAFARALGQKYSSGAPLVNENATAYLGVVGSMGLIWGIGGVLLGSRSRGTHPLATDADALARTNILLLLFATIGGLASLFSLLVSPQLRAWNRISVVIAAISILTLLLKIAWTSDRRDASGLHVGGHLSTLAAVVLLALCFIDQIPRRIEPSVNSYEWDRAFVSDLAAMLPPDSSVFQVPYVGYPEVVPRYKEGFYGLLKPYIHGTSLRWSFGGMKGRRGDLWRQSIDLLPLAEQLKYVANAGFSGVLVHREAYQDHGAAIERELRTIVGPPTLTSGNGTLAFFRLTPGLDGGSTLTPLVVPIRGFWAWENDTSNRWLWSDGNATIGLFNPNPKAGPARLEFQMGSLSHRTLQILVDGHQLETLTLEQGEPRQVRLSVRIEPGEHELRLSSPEAPVREGNDPRSLSFSVMNPRVTIDE